jgi:HEAT repeat protein
MPITMQQVLARLDTDEPEYAALATLGPEVVPHLAVLVRGDDPGLASKAAYLASMIDTDDSTNVVEAAAASSHENVRVAAAAGLRNLAPAKAAPAAERLLDDADVGVRKQALRAVADLGISALEPKMKRMASADPEQGLRQVAKQGLQRIAAVQKARAEAVTPAEAKPSKRGAAKPSKRGAAKSAKRGARRPTGSSKK